MRVGIRELGWCSATVDEILWKYDYEYILILSGDQLYQMDLKEILDFHIEKEGRNYCYNPYAKMLKDATGFRDFKFWRWRKYYFLCWKAWFDILESLKSWKVSERIKCGKDIWLQWRSAYSRGLIAKMFEEGEPGDDFGKRHHRIPLRELHDFKLSIWRILDPDIGTIESFTKPILIYAGIFHREFNLFSSSWIYTKSENASHHLKINGSYVEVKLFFWNGCIIMAGKIENSVVWKQNELIRKYDRKFLRLRTDFFYQGTTEIVV